MMGRCRKNLTRHALRYAFGDLIDTALSHQNDTSAFHDVAVEEKAPPRARVTNALGNATEKNFQGGSRRIGKHDGQIEHLRAQSAPGAPNTVLVGKGQNLVDARMPLPQ